MPDGERAQWKDKSIDPDSNPSQFENEDATGSVITGIGSNACVSITNWLALGFLAPAR